MSTHARIRPELGQNWALQMRILLHQQELSPTGQHLAPKAKTWLPRSEQGPSGQDSLKTIKRYVEAENMHTYNTLILRFLCSMRAALMCWSQGKCPFSYIFDYFVETLLYAQKNHHKCYIEAENMYIYDTPILRFLRLLLNQGLFGAPEQKQVSMLLYFLHILINSTQLKDCSKQQKLLQMLN